MRAFWDLIYTAAGEGVTVFVTTHYMDEAEHCDRLGMIYRGKLVALGSAAQLKREYASGTLLEVEAAPVMQALEVLATGPGIGEVAVFGKHLHVVMAQPAPAAAEQVRQTLAAAGLSAARIEPIVPSLEDVFVALVEEAERAAEAR